ncbi:NAD(P)-dependent alcohol dehydrogenase [Microbacterium suaedae]|uniref:NAD(P)-dependent alcohol dehydrogenase n=1 Tax=Microbacterium suaedae TaxID=2067813 RepID=UPI000DA2255C|nr:NAD(P)-dependent alcohol dehydrogenase [Microbacterium suaedae]
MRAATRDAYGGPELLRIDEAPDPSPKANEVVVRVRATSLNMADLDILFGRPWAARSYYGLTRPRSAGVGIDLAGEVESVGSGVTEFAAHDRVWADVFSHGHAALAERVAVPAEALRRLPDGVSFTDAATAPHCGLMALQLLRSTGPTQSGERVLVNGGGGGVGPFVIQLAKAAGAHVTGVDTGPRTELMLEVGADDAVDFASSDVTRSGRRFDVVLDIADTRSLISLRRLLAPRGRYSLLARRLSSFAEKTLIGPLVGAATGTRMGTFAWQSNHRDQLDELGELLASGTIRPVLDSIRPLEAAPEMLARLAAGTTLGKVVIEP